jgi:hypothetical protein
MDIFDQSDVWLLGVSLVVLALFAYGNFAGRKRTESARLRLDSRIRAIVLSLFAIYFLFSVPYVSYPLFPTKSEDRPITMESTETQLREQRTRLDQIERSLIRSQEQLEKLREHYHRLLLFSVVVVVSLLTSRAFASGLPPEIDEDSKLNLTAKNNE